MRVTKVAAESLLMVKYWVSITSPHFSLVLYTLGNGFSLEICIFSTINNKYISISIKVRNTMNIKKKRDTITWLSSYMGLRIQDQSLDYLHTVGNLTLCDVT